MTIPIERDRESYRAACDAIRAQGKSLGLVPTMGGLHAGHLALVEEARKHADEVAVSIFVNPTQFGANEDLANYPRDLEGDVAGCEAAGATLIFAPEVDGMYPPGACTRVKVEGLSDALCGASRPVHFGGVATVVTKLFALTGRCTAVFGRKDYQQLMVIQRLTRDLMLPVQVIGHPTMREPDGLAMSSRNVYMSAEQRLNARAIPEAISAAVRTYDRGERDARKLIDGVKHHLVAAGLEVDYVTLARPDDVKPLDGGEPLELSRVLLAVAAHSGPTRLIDNAVLGEDAPPIPTGAP